MEKKEREMKLGSKEGIAGEFGFNSLADVLAFEPYVSTWGCQLGGRIDQLAVFAVLQNGEEITLEEGYEYRYASSHTPDIVRDAPSIGEQITPMEGVIGLRFHRHYVCEWEDKSLEDYEEFLPIVPLDWVKIRRRVENEPHNH